MKKLLSLGASAVALTAVTAPAVAQIDTIVVTAERRESTVLDTPVAVSAFTDEQRDRLGIRSIPELVNQTPGVTFQGAPQGTGNRLSIRGIGRLDNAQGTDPGVATYLDGAYLSETRVLTYPALIVDRIEIVRGPQGTLFGRNAIGGAANIVTKRPESEWGAEARVRYGSYDKLDVQATLTGPVPGLEDSTAFRVNGWLINEWKGSQENIDPQADDYNRTADYWYVEAQLSHQFTENFDAWVKFQTIRDNNHPLVSVRREPYDYLGPNSANQQPINYFDSLAPNALYGLDEENPSVDDPTQLDRDFNGHNRLRNTHIGWLELNWRPDWADVKYLGFVGNYTWEYWVDADGTGRASHMLSPLDPTQPGPLETTTFQVNYIGDSKRWRSHELQFSSNDPEDAFQWIGGLYYYREVAEQPYDLRLPKAPDAGTPLIADFSDSEPLCGFFPGIFCGIAAQGKPNPDNNYYHQFGHLVSKAYAAFGQIDYEFLPGVGAKLGLRYTRDEKEGYEEQDLYAFNPYGAFGTPFQWVQLTPNENNRELENDWDAFTGTAGLNWEPTEDTLLYAQYTRGYKTGGFRLGQLSPDDPTTPEDERFVDEETVNAYEIGAKGLFFDNRLSMATSAFYYDYTNQQAPITFIIPGTTISQQQFVNVPASRSLGVEVEVQYAPFENFNVFASYGYLNTEITEFDTPLVNVVLDNPNPVDNLVNVVGNTLPRSPEHSGALNVTYDIPLDALGTATLVGSWIYIGDQHTTLFDDDIYTTEGHSLVNLRVLWTNADEDWTLIASVDNLLDEETALSAGATGSAGNFARTESGIGDRTWYIEAQKRF